LAEWCGRNMRSLAPLYLHSFESSQQLRAQWLRANTMAEWHDAAHAGSKRTATRPHPLSADATLLVLR
jgi:hypothetical protein